MRRIYSNYLPLLAAGFFLAMLMVSCKKEHPQPTPTPTPTSIATLGLYEVDSGIFKRVFIPITMVGNQKVTYYGVFDTGSAGMTIDATGILPASMISNNGIQVAGDSVVVNGITVTTQQAVISYGDLTNETQEYGNLAYAPVTIGDENGNVTTGRIPIFLYYKVVDVNSGKNQPHHSNDVFGVSPGNSYINSAISSPLSYFTSKNGGISGYKLALFNNAQYSFNGTFVPGLLTIGLVPDDIASSSGFIMHPLNYSSIGGYSPDIPATISYGGQTIQASILFDTGTPAINLIENNTSPSNSITLPDHVLVSVTTTSGFNYQYMTDSADNLTQVTRPSFTGDPRTIFSIDFFSSNEFLTDYKNHKIGLKNN